ncbi:MAG TPA: basic secretory protein-like protein [Longimicrobiaceae bacterium]|nr:basic secretory protein-like protein [Longimicrobiaceae bacterium]
MIRQLLSIALVCAAALYALWKANLPQRLRHRQVWSPIVAFLLVAFVLFLFRQVYLPWSRQWEQLAQAADAQLARLGIRPVALLSLGANLLLVAAYTAAKLVVNFFLKRSKRKKGLFGIGLGPAYQDHPEHGVVLRPEWVFPGLLFRTAGWWIGGGLLALAVFATVVRPVPLLLPPLPALPLLLLLEVGWYLGGIPLSDRAGGVGGSGARSERVGDYTPLWEEYQAVWPDHVLAASAAVRLAPAGAAPRVVHRRPGEGDEVQQAVTAAWHGLLAAGCDLGDVHYQLLEQLWRGRDVLLSDPGYDAVAPVLFAFLNQVLVDGHTVLVLLPPARRADPAACERVEEWLHEGLRGAARGGPAWTLARFDEFDRLGALPDLLVAAPEEVLARGVAQDAWAEKLKAVLFVDGERTVFGDPMRTDALLRILRRRQPALQQVILAGDRKTLESAMRENLAAQLTEFRPARPSPPAAFAIVWSLESLAAAGEGRASPPRFQDRVMVSPVGAELGAEAVLALPAWRDGVSPLHLVDQEELPWAEQVEELENHRAGLRDPVPTGALAGSAHEVLRVPAMPHLLPRRPRAFLLARDRDCNLVAALRAWLPTGTASSFVHVVSPPYLLRDYLADSVEYFLQAPLLALSPRLAEGRLAAAYGLLERLAAAPLPEAEVLSQLRGVAPHARFVEEALVELFREVFGVDVLAMSLLEIRRTQRFDEERGGFEEVTTYRLSPEIRQAGSLRWLRPYRILDRGERRLGEVTFDHLYQRYLPGQVHVFLGKPFKVEWVDHDSGIVRVDHERTRGLPAYRPVRRVSVAEVRAPENPAHRERRNEGGWEVESSVCRGSFRVRTPGYFTFAGDVRLTPEALAYTELDPTQVPERVYDDGRLLRVSITPPKPLEAAVRDRIADTLCILLGEALCTLYPETHPFLLPCAPGSEARWGTDAVRALLALMDADPVSPAAEKPGEPLVLYFVEDSHAPLGLTLSLFDERVDVLALLEDYLSWVLEKEEHRGGDWKRNVSRRDRFLRFGRGEPHAALDLKGTHAFVRALLQGQNRLREERRAFLARDRGAAAAEGAAGGRRCDFCARPLRDVEYERLEDGRERCAPCRESAVETVQELKKVYEEGRRFLVDEMGVKVRRDVKVELASAAKVQEAAGQSFLPTADFDRRMAGHGRLDGEQFTLLIENGQPYHGVLGAVVHELTHVWQHTYLDYARMEKEHGALLIEGLAQWAELECLQRKGLVPDYREREESRADVHGHGYRMVVDLQQRYPGLGNPFEILRHQYPAPQRW